MSTFPKPEHVGTPPIDRVQRISPSLPGCARLLQLGFQSLVFLSLCSARMASGAFYVVDDSRHVSSSGHAKAGFQEMSGYNQQQQPGAPFSAFSGNVSSNASSYSYGTAPDGSDESAYSSSSAWQQSIVSDTGFHFYSQVVAQTWSLLPTWGGDCQAFAESAFSVVFSVPEATAFEMTFNRFLFAHDYPALMANCSLVSLESGTVLDLSSIPSNDQIYTGLLLPNNTYLLKVLLRATATLPDPLGELGVVNGSMNFLLVPEPSVPALMVLSVIALHVRKRRLHS